MFKDNIESHCRTDPAWEEPTYRKEYGARARPNIVLQKRLYRFFGAKARSGKVLRRSFSREYYLWDRGSYQVAREHCGAFVMLRVSRYQPRRRSIFVFAFCECLNRESSTGTCSGSAKGWRQQFRWVASIDFWSEKDTEEYRGALGGRSTFN